VVVTRSEGSHQSGTESELTFQVGLLFPEGAAISRSLRKRGETDFNRRTEERGASALFGREKKKACEFENLSWEKRYEKRSKLPAKRKVRASHSRKENSAAAGVEVALRIKGGELNLDPVPWGKRSRPQKKSYHQDRDKEQIARISCDERENPRPDRRPLLGGGTLHPFSDERAQQLRASTIGVERQNAARRLLSRNRQQKIASSEKGGKKSSSSTTQLKRE